MHYRNRPALVRLAICRVWEHDQALSLTRAGVAVLQAVFAAGYNPSTPGQIVFAKKKTLAALAGVSEITVYRALTQLEDGGWITRHAQKQLADGTLAIGELAITERLMEVLCLPTAKTTDQLSAIDDNNAPVAATVNMLAITERPMEVLCLPTAKTTDQLSAIDDNNAPVAATVNICEDQQITSDSTPLDGKSIGGNEQNMSLMQDGLTDGSYIENKKVYLKASVNHQYAPTNVVRMDGRSVPRELVFLIEEKILGYSQLFGLMRHAKQVSENSQTLSDYVALRSDSIRQLTTTHDCYRYLRSLMDQKIDAKNLLRLRQERIDKEQRTATRAAKAVSITRWASQHHEQIFVDQNGNQFTINARIGKVLIAGKGGHTSAALTDRLINRVRTGELTKFTETQVPTDPVKARDSLSRLAALFPAMMGKGKRAINNPAGIGAL
jgi:uncharacterized protein YbaR (Trm112 family)